MAAGSHARSTSHVLAERRGEPRGDDLELPLEASIVILVREWLGGLQLAGLPVAAFGTKVTRPRLPGGAAHAIAKELRRRGGRLAVPAREFGVVGRADGPADGQLDAARAWGAGLAAVAS